MEKLTNLELFPYLCTEEMIEHGVAKEVYVKDKVGYLIGFDSGLGFHFWSKEGEEFELNENEIQLPDTDYDKFEQGTPVVVKYGFNDVLNEPFEFLYEFGYNTIKGFVVYNKGERNMQDSHAFDADTVKIRKAIESDFDRHFWGS